MFSSEVPMAVRGQPKAVPAQRVVTIPVHFIESGRRRSDSAVKIQKVFRGFMVRKLMKKISAIRREVNEIEHRIAEKETFDLIRKNSKEKIKVIEALMSLLFRLDSVRGVDAGVRDFRKAVIKKAIALQELVDAIVSGNQTPELENMTISENQIEEIRETDMDQTLENQGNANFTEHVSNSVDNYDSCPMNSTEQTLGIQNQEEKASNPEPESEVIPDEMIADNDENQEIIEENEYIVVEESVGTTQTESRSDSSMNPEALVEEHGEVNKEEDVIVEDNDHGIESGAREQNNRDLLERMIEDNEKMMGMMAQLFERNEKQTRMLSTLSQRVEQLEKAFMCEKLRRKKRNAAGPASDVLERSPDYKKCGKR